MASSALIVPNEKLTDDEERARDARIGTCCCPRCSAFGPASCSNLLPSRPYILCRHHSDDVLHVVGFWKFPTKRNLEGRRLARWQTKTVVFPLSDIHSLACGFQKINMELNLLPGNATRI